MSATLNSIEVQTHQPASLAGWIQRHPLTAYFLGAFTGTWLIVLPIVLSQRALGLLSLPEAVLMVLFILSALTGPLLSALIVTGITEGKSGLAQFLKRMVQWRVGGRWWLLVVLGYPLVLALGLMPWAGSEPLVNLVQQWPLLLSFYLPQLALGLLMPGLGEEPGWRGFALPKLQRRYGPLVGSLVLGIVHAAWHLPVYFVPGFITLNGFDLTIFISNSLTIIACTLLWTWLFNHANGSILFAMFFHAASNAAVALMGQLTRLGQDSPWQGLIIFGIAAMIIVGITRGRLGYNSQNQSLRLGGKTGTDFGQNEQNLTKSNQ